MAQPRHIPCPWPCNWGRELIHTQFGDGLRVPELVASLASLLHCFGRSLAHWKQFNGLLYFLDPLCGQGVHLDKMKLGREKAHSVNKHFWSIDRGVVPPFWSQRSRIAQLEKVADNEQHDVGASYRVCPLLVMCDVRRNPCSVQSSKQCRNVQYI